MEFLFWIIQYPEHYKRLSNQNLFYTNKLPKFIPSGCKDKKWCIWKSCFVKYEIVYIRNKDLKQNVKHEINITKLKIYLYRMDWQQLSKIGISQMPGYLGKFPNAWVSGKYPKCLGFREIPQIFSYLRNFQNLKNIPSLNTYRNFGYLQTAWVYGKFPK